jgi:hypothetical protein
MSGVSRSGNPKTSIDFVECERTTSIALKISSSEHSEAQATNRAGTNNIFMKKKKK